MSGAPTWTVDLTDVVPEIGDRGLEDRSPLSRGAGGVRTARVRGAGVRAMGPAEPDRTAHAEQHDARAASTARAGRSRGLVALEPSSAAGDD